MTPTPDAEGDVLSDEAITDVAVERWKDWCSNTYGEIPWRSLLASVAFAVRDAILSHMEAAHRGEVAARDAEIGRLTAELTAERRTANARFFEVFDAVVRYVDAFDAATDEAREEAGGMTMAERWAMQALRKAIDPDWSTAHARHCLPTCDGTRPACRWSAHAQTVREGE